MKQVSKVKHLNKYPSYKGGDTIVTAGYIHEYCPRHPLANIWGFVAQHRLIGEDLVGRALVREGKEAECVHHEDENPLNNSPDNLKVMTKTEHRRHHATLMNQRRREHLSESSVSSALKIEGGITSAAKRLGVHHQTLRNLFPHLVFPYKRSSPIDLEHTEHYEHLLETARYFAPTKMGYTELAKLTRVCGKTWRRICQDNGIQWNRQQGAVKGKRRLTYRGKPTRFALESYGKKTVLV